MYISTVLKMLQQAVEEIKRGMNLIKQDQKVATASNQSSGSMSSSSQRQPTSNNINQIQKEKIQASLAYKKAISGE